MSMPFLKPADIVPGSVWTACSGTGHEVTVKRVLDDWVEYSWIEKGETRVHEKDSFSFQVRYMPKEN